MSDGLLQRWWPWPYQERLPAHPERTEEEPGDGHIPGLIDEAN